MTVQGEAAIDYWTDKARGLEAIVSGVRLHLEIALASGLVAVGAQDLIDLIDSGAIA